jgi:putative transposase
LDSFIPALTTYENQATMLVAEKKDGNFQGIFSQVLQDVLRRLDKSFRAFFRRVKAGEKPGYPRFKGKGWYKSFTYPQAGFKLDGSKQTERLNGHHFFLHS